MNLKEQAISGVVWSGIQRWGTRASGFVVFFLLARLLGPEDFGIIALAGAFIAIADVFISGGFNDAIVQRDDLEPEHLDTAFWINIGLGLFMTALGFSVAPFIAQATSEPILSPVIRWLSLGFILSALSNVQNAVLQRNFLFKTLALRNLAGILVGGSTGILMAFLGYGIWSLVFQQLVTQVISTATLWVLSDWRPKLRIHRRHFNDLISFELNMLGSRLLVLVDRRADDLLIGFFLGPVALGLYSLAYRFIYILTELFTRTLIPVAFSTFSRMQKDKNRIRQSFYNATGLSSLFAFPVFIGLAAIAPEFVIGVFGEQWAQSIPIMQILCFVGIVQSVSLFNGVVIRAVGKPSWSFRLSLGFATCSLVGFLIAVHYGVIAVATAYVIRGYLFAPIGAVLVKKLINIDLTEYLRRFVVPAASSLVMVAVIIAAKLLFSLPNLYVELTVYILLGIFSYFLGVRLLSPGLFNYVFEMSKQTVRRPSRKQIKVP